MKRNLFVFILALFSVAKIFAGVDVTFPLAYFTGDPFATNRVIITPTNATPGAVSVIGGNIIAGQRLIYTNDSSGLLTVSNMAAPQNYWVECVGKDYTTRFLILVTNSATPLSAKDLIVNVATNAAGQGSYTAAESDARYAPIGSSAQEVQKIGDRMTGPLTNTAGFYLPGDAGQENFFGPYSGPGLNGFSWFFTNATSGNVAVDTLDLTTIGLTLNKGVFAGSGLNLTALRGSNVNTIYRNNLLATTNPVTGQVTVDASTQGDVMQAGQNNFSGSNTMAGPLNLGAIFISNNIVTGTANETNSGNIQSATFNATGQFNGSGAGLTALNASQLSSGTIPNAAFPATLPAVSGAQLTNVLRSYITPFDCGAVGDNVTDDAAALKKWLFIASRSNWVAYLPPAPGGAFACSQTLLITNGMNWVNIQGAGGSIFPSDGIANMSASAIRFTAAVDGLRITNAQANIRMECFRLTNSAAFSYATHGIWFDGPVADNDMASLRHVGASGFGKGLTISSLADAVIENCNFGYCGDGVLFTNGTYTGGSPVINQVALRGCQLSYAYSNSVNVTAGSFIEIDNCDMAQGKLDGVNGAVGLWLHGHGSVCIRNMHIEQNGTAKAAIVMTDEGTGVGNVSLSMYDVNLQSDSSPGAGTYSIINTNGNLALYNASLQNLSDATFSMLISADANQVHGDTPYLCRLVTGGGIATNYLGGYGNLPMMNFGALGSYVKEGSLLRQLQDFNPTPGGGIGGGYIWSHFWYGARMNDVDGSFGTVPICLLQYYEDRASNGGGVGVTNAGGLVLYGGSYGGMCKTNLATVAISMTTPVALLPVSANTTFTALANVDATKTMVQHVVTFVTNSAIGTITLTAPANVFVVGSTTVTRWSQLDWWVYAQLRTNLIITPVN